MSYQRKQEDKRRLKKLHDETKYNFATGAYFSERKDRLVRSYPSNTPGLTKWLRRISNKKVRRNEDNLNNSLYKRIFDYWWWIT